MVSYGINNEEFINVLLNLFYDKDFDTKKLNKPKNWKTIRKNNLKKIKI